MTEVEFLELLGPMAREDMAKTGVPASLTLAQAILESGWGNSLLTREANNLFGIKGSYQGKSLSCKTFEYVEGKRVEITAAFRQYPSWRESVEDHSSLFLRLPRYKNLIGCADYRQACKNVQADGYATAPGYADSLIRLIEQYDLTAYEKWRVEVFTFTRREDAHSLHEALSHLKDLSNVVRERPSGGFAVVIQSFCSHGRAAEVADGIRKLTGFYCEVLSGERA